MRVEGVGLRVLDLGCGVQSSGFRVVERTLAMHGFGFRVSNFSSDTNILGDV